MIEAWGRRSAELGEAPERLGLAVKLGEPGFALGNGPLHGARLARAGGVQRDEPVEFGFQAGLLAIDLCELQLRFPPPKFVRDPGPETLDEALPSLRVKQCVLEAADHGAFELPQRSGLPIGAELASLAEAVCAATRAVVHHALGGLFLLTADDGDRAAAGAADEKPGEEVAHGVSEDSSRMLALMRKRRNLDRPPAHDRGLRRAGFASSASRAL